MPRANVLQSTTFIYGLNDPDTGACRYIGKSDRPKERFKLHLWQSKNVNSHRECWIAGLMNAGKLPVLEILDEVPRIDWQYYEREYIRIFRAIGFSLTNGTLGGEGAVPTERTREKMRRVKLGIKRPFGSVDKKIMTMRRVGPRSDSVSGFKGVGFCRNEKRVKRWVANIKVDGRTIRLGRFYTKESAALAYNQAAWAYYGPNCYLNKL